VGFDFPSLDSVLFSFLPPSFSDRSACDPTCEVFFFADLTPMPSPQHQVSKDSTEPLVVCRLLVPVLLFLFYSLFALGAHFLFRLSSTFFARLVQTGAARRRFHCLHTCRPLPPVFFFGVCPPDLLIPLRSESGFLDGLFILSSLPFYPHSFYYAHVLRIFVRFFFSFFPFAPMFARAISGFLLVAFFFFPPASAAPSFSFSPLRCCSTTACLYFTPPTLGILSGSDFFFVYLPETSCMIDRYVHLLLSLSDPPSLYSAPVVFISCFPYLEFAVPLIRPPRFHSDQVPRHLYDCFITLLHVTENPFFLITCFRLPLSFPLVQPFFSSPTFQLKCSLFYTVLSCACRFPTPLMIVSGCYPTTVAPPRTGTVPPFSHVHPLISACPVIEYLTLAPSFLPFSSVIPLSLLLFAASDRL